MLRQGMIAVAVLAVLGPASALAQQSSGRDNGYDRSDSGPPGSAVHGIPPMAQRQAAGGAATDVYEQWNYTGWNGLTERPCPAPDVKSHWDIDNQHYVEATPPPLPRRGG